MGEIHKQLFYSFINTVFICILSSQISSKAFNHKFVIFLFGFVITPFCTTFFEAMLKDGVDWICQVMGAIRLLYF